MAISVAYLSGKSTLLPWNIEAEHSLCDFIRPRLPSISIESWIDLVKAEVGTSIDNRIMGLEEVVYQYIYVF